MTKVTSLLRHARHILLCQVDCWSVLLVAAFTVIWIPIANTSNAKLEWCNCQVGYIANTLTIAMAWITNPRDTICQRMPKF